MSGASDRYPTFSPRGQPEMQQRGGGYDRSLLAGAPSISRADRQEGYNIDILERQPAPYPTGGRTRINLDDPSFASAAQPYGGNNYNNGNTSNFTPIPPLEQSPYHERSNLPSSPPLLVNPYQRKVPFWRTKKGIIVGVAGIILFIGIIAGVVAGVTIQNNSHKKADAAAELANGNGAVVGSTQATRTNTADQKPSVATLTSATGLVTPTLVLSRPAVQPSTGVGSGTGNGTGNGRGDDDDEDDEDDADPIGAVRPTARPPSTDICTRFPNIRACRDN